MKSIWIGFDSRETAAFAVCRDSILNKLTVPIPIYGMVLDNLRRRGLYTRPTSQRIGRLWDDISNAPMSTEFANSRFLVPHLAQTGWALFMDCDMLVRTNLARVFELTRNDKAVMCVKHNYMPADGEKMDGQIQTRYPRKNWSSFCLFNCDHPANRSLTPEFVNTATGRDMHHFCWLKDDDIGELDVSWNWLVGYSPEPPPEPKVVHYTDGLPSLTAFKDAPYADEWREVLYQWARPDFKKAAAAA